MALQAAQQRQIKEYVSKIERLNDERDALGGDIKDLLASAKDAGLSVKAIRRVIATRRKNKKDFLDEEDTFDQYLAATSWLDTPLGAQSDIEGPRLVAVNE